MRIIALLASIVLIFATLLDAFETILQPRRVTHRFRLARFYYRNTWRVWRGIASGLRLLKDREAMLGAFGPLSLLGLFVTWIVGLISGFAILHWSIYSPMANHGGAHSIREYFYLSGTTFFTLGYGDITPTAPIGRVLAVIESGLGFGFLAVVISYLPVLYQAFSRRETMISLMDARAGSPPSAGQFLLRLARGKRMSDVERFLIEWEEWSAELLESHLSFPVLSYYRSQHDNQSWLAALATILDTCALLIAQVKQDTYQAQLTFAMARHAAVDLSLVLKVPPRGKFPERAPHPQRQQLLTLLREAGVELRNGDEVEAKFAYLRGMYEPFLHALSQRFVLALPPLAPEDSAVDNWQRSAWMQRTPGIGNLLEASPDKDHFT